MWDNSIINLDEAMGRVMGQKAMYIRWLKKFFLADTLNEIEKAFQNNDHTAAHAATHKIKGTAANLAVTVVAEQAAKLDQMVKDNASFESMKPEYERLFEAFNQASDMFSQNEDHINNY